MPEINIVPETITVKHRNGEPFKIEDLVSESLEIDAIRSKMSKEERPLGEFLEWAKEHFHKKYGALLDPGEVYELVTALDLEFQKKRKSKSDALKSVLG